MKSDNDNRLTILPDDPFVRLPLFATDREIAVALVGASRAGRWLKERFPTISAKHGFPPADAFHGGRAVPLVRLFYQGYLGMTGGSTAPGKPDGEENWGAWKKSKQSG